MPLDQQLLHFQKLKKSTLLIVPLKAGELVKRTEVGRLFHALMTLLAKKDSDSAVTTRFIQFECMSSRAYKLRKLKNGDNLFFFNRD